MAYVIFLTGIRLEVDARISAVLRQCTGCGQELPEMSTTQAGGVLLLFVQCPQCRRVFLADTFDVAEAHGDA